MKSRKNIKRTRLRRAVLICLAVLLAICCAAWYAHGRRLSQEEMRAQAQTEAEAQAKKQAEAEVKEEQLKAELGQFASSAHEELPATLPALDPSETGVISIIVDKSEHLLTLYSDDEEIARYTVGLARDPSLAAKQQVGDNRTPEGSYTVCMRNEQSKYHLALGLSYPNADDAARGLEDGLITQEEYDAIVYAVQNGQQPSWDTQLGGQIMIHGQKGNLGGQCDWTTGCIAVSNDVMDILWQYCPVGTAVTIVA